MTLPELIALQPAWIGHWINWMTLATYVTPVVLLFWRPSRKAGIVGIIGGVLSGVGVAILFERMGYVRLLGLSHVVFWTPTAIYLIGQLKRADMPRIPRILIGIMAATIVVSLMFDYTDVARYFLGDQTPFTG